MPSEALPPAIDPLVSGPGREGLAGTAPQERYARDPELLTLAPDGRAPELQPAWRNDFPIDWPQDHYVSRRDFAKFMVLTSLAFAVGQLWIVGLEWRRRRRGRPDVRRIASLSALPVGGALSFDYPGPHDGCLLIRTADRLVAYSQKCTHLSCAVVPELARGVLHCPCHEGYFDVGSGRPLAGPPRRPLPRIRIELRGDDVYATGVEERSS
jgi:nitrite reductase/ring-hydroxylating ferredoxin subunit